LADQNQKICIRRESNACRICYTIEDANDFMLSGDEEDDGTAIPGLDSACCGAKDDALG